MVRVLATVVQVLLFATPWPIRRLLLCKLFRFEIDPAARIGFSVVLARRLRMRKHSRIGNFNLVNRIDALEMGVDSGIGSLNYITGYPGDKHGHFEHISERRCQFILEQGAGITSRHFVDCTCGVLVGKLTTVAGIGSLLLTHSVDVRLSRQSGAPIVIGEGCFIGAKVTVLPGVVIADHVVIAAGSVVYKSIVESYGVYSSHELREIARLDPNNFAYANRVSSNVP